MPNFIVKAHWDREALAWWAESDDVIGLVSEAETHEQLVENLRQLIPELLTLNMPEMDRRHVTFELISDQIEACFAV